jgi:hypothetical protein
MPISRIVVQQREAGQAIFIAQSQICRTTDLQESRKSTAAAFLLETSNRTTEMQKYRKAESA